MKAFNGNTTNILIFTNIPLYDTEELYDFLRRYEDINCHFIKSIKEFEPDTMGIPDFLVIVEALIEADYSKIIEPFRKINPGAFCILWGMVDDVLKNRCNAYHFNTCFERYAPYDDFLKYLQLLVQKNNFDLDFEFDEICLSADLPIDNREYQIVACENDLIKIRSFGIRPLLVPGVYDNTIHNTAHYKTENDRLLLSELCIKDHSAVLPPINGITAQSADYPRIGHRYENVDLPLSYTGAILLGKDANDIIKNSKNCIINRLFGWKELILLHLENGKIIKSENMNWLINAIKCMCILFPLFRHIPIFAKRPRVFLYDITQSVSPSAYKTLYWHFMRYFNMTHKQKRRSCKTVI